MTNTSSSFPMTASTKSLISLLPSSHQPLEPSVFISSLPVSTTHHTSCGYTVQFWARRSHWDCCVYGTGIAFQQLSLPRLSDLSVRVEFSSYLPSFTAAPFQLYRTDWLCRPTVVPEGSSGPTEHSNWKLWPWLSHTGLKLTSAEQWLALKTTSYSIHHLLIAIMQRLFRVLSDLEAAYGYIEQLGIHVCCVLFSDPCLSLRSFNQAGGNEHSGMDHG